ncbi:hypothetical protein L798_02677 [Zootermopsis nevadensis]|uniref:Uncharacterized protein n=1 Tax=Zootermopsis nevadensis TaxID=136037 RepID=A0A067QU50_ZOONE|nr:hypothetical protein L798_02677 [Zootermopsis nevadensis]
MTQTLRQTSLCAVICTRAWSETRDLATSDNTALENALLQIFYLLAEHNAQVQKNKKYT